MSEVEETAKPGKIFELEEVKKHTREDDCWLVVDGDVYDVTEFLDEHPGGFDIIISNTGASLSALAQIFDCLGCQTLPFTLQVRELGHLKPSPVDTQLKAKHVQARMPQKTLMK